MKSHKRTFLTILSIFTIISLACQCSLPAAFTGPTPTPTEQPEPLPPQVVYVTPARGEEQALTAPVQLVFDQAMDAESVENAFSIEPAVRGTFEWITDRVVQFTPATGFDRATRYTLTLSDRARSTQGLGMEDDFQYRFTTVGFLEVSAVYPADETEEVALDATVTVLFNRPVVPLTAIEGLGDLPKPLTFNPPVTGKGEWLNTSIYMFTPDEGFAPATTYRAQVASGLSDTTGGVLADDFAWSFTTVMPAVVATHPSADTLYVSTEPTVYVAFNQPMDHASVEAAFTLKNRATGQAVSGTFAWQDGGLVPPSGDYYEPYAWSWDEGKGPAAVGVETMSFTPREPLDFETTYEAQVAAGAKGAAGNAGTQRAHRWTFQTIAYPRIVHTYPADGEERANPWDELNITFSSPMDPESIVGNFTISPPVSATEVYTYWWDSNTQLSISFPTDASSEYEVTISGDVQGRYGHKLGEDVTIHWRTRAYDPQVYLHAPYRVGTYSAYTQTFAYVTVLNVGRVNFSLYRMPVEDFRRANGEDGWSFWDKYQGGSDQLVRTWTLDANPPLNERRVYRTLLSGTEDGRLEPGIYYLEVSADYDTIYPEARYDVTPYVNKQILVVSRYNLSLKTTGTESLVWATDLQSGQVAPGMPVLVMNETGDVLAQGTTDQDGVFASGEHQRVDRWEPTFAFTGDPAEPDADFAVAISGWEDGISRWNFGLPVEDYEVPYSGYLFTDRPIYRPGQTVYFKGVLRGDDDARYSLLQEGARVDVEIWDPQGTQVFEGKLTLNDMGTLNGELILDEEAALGTYYIRASLSSDGDQEFATTFRVAEYRKPEFQVEVETDRPAYVHGDEIAVTAQATYFFGGPVANAEVRYAVLSANYYFNYQGPGWWSFADYDYDDWWREQPYGVYGELIAEGAGTTDGQGRFTFSLEADIAEEVTSQRFTLEVTVVDVNNQEVSNRTEAVVHKGTYYIGLRPEKYVGQTGEESAVNLITVDWESEPSPNRELTVVFAKYRWYSVQKQAEDGRYYWESAVEVTPVFTTTARTDGEGRATAAFVPEAGGTYKVTASGRDEKGNTVRSATFMWVSGREYVSWRVNNNDRIDLVADKRQYQVGDTATILIPHPYQGPVEALITVERGHIYRHWVQTLETNSEQIQIPITEDLIPNVFVSVVIVKGVDETNALPSFKVGYAELPIETTEKELTITLTPDKPADEHYGPAQVVTYDVHVADSAGNPVEAEVALALADLAVLTLADRPGPGLVGHFWRERGLGVRTSSGLAQSGDRVNEELAEEVKGLGGGGGGEEFGPVRRRFVDLAYWNATLRTGADGHATVSVELPDNLTTWRMHAWGVTAETLVGEGEVDIISTKDLLVRPVNPRFFVVGDEAQLGAVVQNNTDQPLEVEVTFEAEGLQLSGTARQQVSISAGGNAVVAWPVKAQDVAQAKLFFGAKGGGLADAVEISLPVYRYSTPEVVATAGTLKSDGQVIEAAVLPPSYDPSQGELSVHVEGSLAAGMTDGLYYLEHYPYECTEQTVSRFLPNIVAYRALKELGVSDPELEQRLPGLVSTGLQRLYYQQHYDGGWGWWVTDESRPYLTAYVLLGLIEAERAGFTVDEEVMKRATTYLRGSLARPRDLEEHWQANRQAFVLYVLAEAGRGDAGRTVTLFENRATLDTFGKAYLAMAFGLLGEKYQQQVDTLLSDITSAAIVSATGAHWEEEQVDYYAMNTDTRSTAIVLAALARLDPENPLAPNAVRWLMVARKDGYWETTQETAWSIIALTDWMVATGELEGAYSWHVVVNGELLGEGSVSRQNIKETTKLQIEVAKLLADEANRIVIERWAPEGQSAGTGRLYYSLYLRYYKPVEEVTALNRGIIVSRRYTLADCDAQEGVCPAVSGAQVGDVIQVKLTIIAPNDLHYVVVEDPLPAGAEAVDQSLKTTSVVGEPPTLTRTDRRNPWGGGYGWWWFSHVEMRDEKVVLFAPYLPRGTYEYTYLIRASLAGEYRVIPTTAYEMYFPEVFGRSDGGLFKITE